MICFFGIPPKARNKNVPKVGVPDGQSYFLSSTSTYSASITPSSFLGSGAGSPAVAPGVAPAAALAL